MEKHKEIIIECEKQMKDLDLNNQVERRLYNKLETTKGYSEWFVKVMSK